MMGKHHQMMGKFGLTIWKTPKMIGNTIKLPPKKYPKSLPFGHPTTIPPVASTPPQPCYSSSSTAKHQPPSAVIKALKLITSRRQVLSISSWAFGCKQIQGGDDWFKGNFKGIMEYRRSILIWMTFFVCVYICPQNWGFTRKCWRCLLGKWSKSCGISKTNCFLREYNGESAIWYLMEIEPTITITAITLFWMMA